MSTLFSRATVGVTRVRRMAAGREVGLAYPAIVICTYTVLGLLAPARRDAVLAACSTNLDNLHRYPPAVLLASAFVLASPWDLLLLPVSVWAYGTVQRWLGRAATVIMAVLAHVGASVLVATMLAARIHRGEVSRSVAGSVDVGISYGLAGMLGLLTARVPIPRRRWLIAAVTATLLGLVVYWRDFVDLGHLTAWSIGVAVSVLVRRAGASAVPVDD